MPVTSMNPSAMKFSLILGVLVCTNLNLYAQDSTKTSKATIWKRMKQSQHARPNAKLIQPSQQSFLPIDSFTNKVSFREIIEAKGTSKQSLFAKIKKWIVTKNSPSNPYAINLESEAQGSIIAKGTFTLP